MGFDTMRSLFVAAAFALLPPALAHTAPAYQQGSYEPTFDMSELNRFHGKQPVTRKIKAPKTLTNQSFAAQPCNNYVAPAKVTSNGVVFANYNEQGATMVAFRKQYAEGTFDVVGDYNPHSRRGIVAIHALNLDTTFHVTNRQVVMDDPNAADSALCAAQTLMNHYDQSAALRAKHNGQSGQPDGWYGPFVAPNGKDLVSGGTLGGRSYTFRWTADKHVFASSSFAEPNGTYTTSAITLRPFRQFPDKLGELTKRLTGHDPASDAGQVASARILLLANALHSYSHPEDGPNTNSPQNTAIFSVRSETTLWDTPPNKDLQILNANEINPRTGKDYLDPNKTQGMSNRAFQAHLESMLRDAGGSAPSPYRYMPQSGAFPSPR